MKVHRHTGIHAASETGLQIMLIALEQICCAAAASMSLYKHSTKSLCHDQGCGIAPQMVVREVEN